MSKKNNNWEYATSEESTGHVNLKKEYGLYINGEWVKLIEEIFFLC